MSYLEGSDRQMPAALLEFFLKDKAAWAALKEQLLICKGNYLMAARSAITEDRAVQRMFGRMDAIDDILAMERQAEREFENESRRKS